MGRCLTLSVLASLAVATAAGLFPALHAAPRAFASSREGELIAEAPRDGSWCKADVTLTVRGKDDSFFTVGETDEQGRHARFILNRLVSAVRQGLVAECPQARSLTINGFVDDVFIYRGYASRDNPNDEWILFDMPVALVEAPPPPDPMPVVEPATAAVSSSSPPPAPRQEALAECDTLAAHPDDPGKPKGIAGITDDALNAGAALRACEEAARFAPDNIRVKYQLARAYLLYDKYAEGVELMTDAAEGGHGAATAALGDFALYGVLDEEPDPETAKALYLKATKAGFKPAAKLASEIVANPREDKTHPAPQEPEYHEPNRMAILLRGEPLPGEGGGFVRTMVYAMNTIAGIKYQCPDAGVSWLSPYAMMAVVSKRMGGGSLNGLFGGLAMAEGNFPDLEQAAMDDGYALAFTKGCASPEVRAVQESFRRTFQ